MNNLCESCVKRKTMYCPNSSKCYSKQDKPYWESGLMLLQKLEAYENMRKDLLDLILYQYPALSQSESDFKDDLLNVLNKVGSSDE